MNNLPQIGSTVTTKVTKTPCKVVGYINSLAGQMLRIIPLNNRHLVAGATVKQLIAWNQTFGLGVDDVQVQLVEA